MKKSIIHKYELDTKEVSQAMKNRVNMPHSEVTYSCDKVNGYGHIRLALVEKDGKIESVSEPQMYEAIQSYLEAFDIRCELSDITFSIKDTNEFEPFVKECKCLIEIIQ